MQSTLKYQRELIQDAQKGSYEELELSDTFKEQFTDLKLTVHTRCENMLLRKKHRLDHLRMHKTYPTLQQMLDHWFPRKPMDTPMCRKPPEMTSAEPDQPSTALEVSRTKKERGTKSSVKSAKRALKNSKTQAHSKTQSKTDNQVGNPASIAPQTPDNADLQLQAAQEQTTAQGGTLGGITGMPAETKTAEKFEEEAQTETESDHSENTEVFQRKFQNSGHRESRLGSF